MNTAVDGFFKVHVNLFESIFLVFNSKTDFDILGEFKDALENSFAKLGPGPKFVAILGP